MAALGRARRLQLDAVAPRDIAAMRIRQIAADNLQRQRMALHLGAERAPLRLRSLDAEPRQQRRAGLLAQAAEYALRRGGGIALEVFDLAARRHQTEASIAGREGFKQRGQRIVLQPPLHRRVGRILQRLQPVEDQQRSAFAQGPREPFPLLVAALALDRRQSEEFQRLGEEQVRRGAGLFARPLPIERPRERRLRARPAARGQRVGERGDQRRLALAAERDKGQHMRMRLTARRPRPGVCDKSSLRLAADQIFGGVDVDAVEVERGRGGARHGDIRDIARRSRYHRANFLGDHGGLLRQFAIEVIVLRIGNIEVLQPIAAMLLKGVGNVLRVRVIEQNRDEALVLPLFVEIVVDQRAFPEGSAPLVEGDEVFDAGIIFRRADHQHEARVLLPQPFRAPSLPTMRRPDDELIDFDFQAALAQRLRQREHARRMRVAVVAVADENLDRLQCGAPRRLRNRASLADA